MKNNIIYAGDIIKKAAYTRAAMYNFLYMQKNAVSLAGKLSILACITALMLLVVNSGV